MAEQHTNNHFDVIIIGGSYAGLSAAMALGRALRKVLIIDSGQPCNQQTPHSHNFLTRDGQTPAEIAVIGKQQVLAYPSIKFHEGTAEKGSALSSGFQITTDTDENFTATKLIFATGIRDILPGIKGFSDCWGISVLHCPYCHGYEVRNEKTAVIANGDTGFEYVKMISNWTKDLTLFTNGKAELTEQQSALLKQFNIAIVETEVKQLEHVNGQVQTIVLADNSTFPVKAVYYKPAFKQHCDIPVCVGCELTEQGHIKTDMFQKTTVPGIFACGDNATMFRAIASAVASGAAAGAATNKELIDEAFTEVHREAYAPGA